MDIDSLIDRVCEMVSERLKKMEPEKKVLLLGQKGSPYCDELYSMLEEDFYVYDMESYKVSRTVAEYDFLVLPYLTVRQLISMQMGSYCCLQSRAVIDGLMLNKNIYIIEENIEYRKFEKSCSPEFFSMLKGYEGRLKDFGISIVKKQEIVCSMKQGVCNAPENEGKEEIIKTAESLSGMEPVPETSKALGCVEGSVYVLDKKILTESDVCAIARQGYKKIEASRRAVITPSAYDSMKVRSILLERK